MADEEVTVLIVDGSLVGLTTAAGRDAVARALVTALARTPDSPAAGV